MKYLNALLPLVDYLYIFQVMEYDSNALLRWFFKHPFERNLQRKHRIVFSKKMLLLFAISMGFILLTAVIESGFFPNWLIGFLILLLVFINLSPIFIVASYALLQPLEIYARRKILRAAKAKRQRLPNLIVVAIVGSFAKTSTKDMLYTLLWKQFQVAKTPKSFNTPLSVARTLLTDVKENTEIFIVEMDAYKPGEIDELCRLVAPQVGIITAIAPQHLERFGSMERLAKTQFEVAEHLKAGTLILCSQSEWILTLAEQYKGQQVYYYGLRNKDDFYASELDQAPEGVQFLLHARPFVSRQARIEQDTDKAIAITIPLYGEHHVTNFLGATAAAMLLGLPLKTIKDRAMRLLPTPHRLEVKRLGAMTLIDNSYNSNPTSFDASLHVLKNFHADQKILITPGFIEVGTNQNEENKNLAKKAATVISKMIIVGDHAKADLLRGLEEVSFPKDDIHLAKNTQEALQLVQTITHPGAVVLIENDLPDQYF